MFNLLEEFEKLLKEAPLPYERKPVLKEYDRDGLFQEICIACSPRSVISISIYRDELQTDCYVYENNQWMNYQLGNILYNRSPKRKHIPGIEKPANKDSFDEQRLYGIKCIHYSLLQYGDDVLKGDLEWTKESPYPPTRGGDPSYIFDK